MPTAPGAGGVRECEPDVTFAGAEAARGWRDSPRMALMLTILLNRLLGEYSDATFVA